MGAVNARLVAKEAVRFVLAFMVVALVCVLAVCIVAGAVVLNPHTYEKTAASEHYLMGIEETVTGALETAAMDTGLPLDLLERHVPDGLLRGMAAQNAADAAALLDGKLDAYNASFDEAALLADIENYYMEEMGAPAGGAQQQALVQTAAAVRQTIERATRVPDMQQLAHTGAFAAVLPVLRFAAGWGILVAVACMAAALWGLYRMAGKEFTAWLWGTALCAGIALLLPVILINAARLPDIVIQPVQLELLYKQMLDGAQCVLAAMAAICFAAGGASLWAALSKQKKRKEPCGHTD